MIDNIDNLTYVLNLLNQIEIRGYEQSKKYLEIFERLNYVINDLIQQRESDENKEAE